MPNYRCLIRGESFPGLDGDERPYGFITTRWVKALNPWRAELKAVEMIRREFRPLLPRDHPFAPRARLYREEITKIKCLPRFRGGGAIWFPMNEERPSVATRLRERLEQRFKRRY